MVDTWKVTLPNIDRLSSQSSIVFIAIVPSYDLVHIGGSGVHGREDRRSVYHGDGVVSRLEQRQSGGCAKLASSDDEDTSLG